MCMHKQMEAETSTHLHTSETFQIIVRLQINILCS